MKTEILFEDQEILVVYKPAGIATQAAGFMQADVVSELKNYLVLTNKQKKEPYLGLIHRLDQPVEGVLVFAKTPYAAANLSRQAADRTLKKEYIAAVLAEKDENHSDTEKKKQVKTILTDYMLKDGKTNTSKIVKSSEKNAKKAVLSYEVIKTAKIDREKYVALLKIYLETGRHHQIRVQLANANMPLLGDLKYGSEASKSISAELKIRDVALCAGKLIFKHPKTGKTLEFRISPKKDILNNLTV